MVSINDPLLPPTLGHKRKEFTIFRRISLKFSVGVILFCIGSIIGATGQSVSLPLFLSTLIDSEHGMPAYFVLWICSLTFTIVFSLGSLFLIYKGAVDPEMRQWKWHKYMFLVGIFDAMNGICVVYASFLARVPGPISAILGNSSIVFTLVMSKFILKKIYSPKQTLGAIMVLGGILISLIPTLISIHKDGAGKSAAWWWPLVFLFGFVPGALMNVVQEYMQDKYRKETTSSNKRFSVIYFQAVESTYQFLSITLLFWTDFLPHFGVANNFSSFWDTFSFDFLCFFNHPQVSLSGSRCDKSGGIGSIFLISYLITYIFGTEMTMYASANMSSVVGAISPLLSTLFWFIFPKINAWGGGAPLTHVDLAYDLGAFPLIFCGIIFYRYFEVEDKKPDEEELEEGGIELCW